MNCLISDTIKTPPVWVECSRQREPDSTRRRYLTKKARPARSVLKISAPYNTHFSSPDSLIADNYNSLDWDRYAYSRSNPLKYNDPSGHWPDSPMSWLSPLAYDTVGFGFSGVLKEVLGVDADVMVYVNAKAIRDSITELNPQHLKEFDFSVNLEANVSVGVSAEGLAGVTVMGVDGSVADQAGVNVSLVNGAIPVNVGGCLPVGVCGTASNGLKTDSPGTTSAAYTFAVGEGVDLSADAFGISVDLYHQIANEKGYWVNPVEFTEKSYQKFREQWKKFWTKPE